MLNPQTLARERGSCRDFAALFVETCRCLGLASHLGCDGSQILGRIVTIVIGLIAVGFAIPEARFIFWFVLFSWSGLGAAFGPVVLALLYDKRTTGAGIVAGMLGGFLTSVVWVQYFKAGAHGLYEAIPGFIVAALATVVVSRMTGK